MADPQPCSRLTISKAQALDICLLGKDRNSRIRQKKIGVCHYEECELSDVLMPS